MIALWNKDTEIEFFKKSLALTTPEQLFYKTSDNRYLAYWPKGYEGQKTTLQSRNAFIGDYTEKWSLKVLKDFADKIGAFVVQSVVCEKIELKRNSPADLAFCKTNNRVQKPEDIIMIFEVKMSVVWNWEYLKSNGELKCIGDYTTHQGNPGLLRSDTMLKAIGKSINIRVSGLAATKIPVVILGNTPITESYYEKVDHLKKFGIIQGFWSLNPEPRDEIEIIKNTETFGFKRMDTYEELSKNLNELLAEEREFFSGMKTKRQLGNIIEIANREESYEKKAEKFLSLLMVD
ncbi:MAG: hypothetical protein U9O50_07880 [Acidobacteriota bacterium]|nr:hypothetical protein [Acidobacteriota bacterium]